MSSWMHGTAALHFVAASPQRQAKQTHLGNGSAVHLPQQRVHSHDGPDVRITGSCCAQHLGKARGADHVQARRNGNERNASPSFFDLETALRPTDAASTLATTKPTPNSDLLAHGERAPRPPLASLSLYLLAVRTSFLERVCVALGLCQNDLDDDELNFLTGLSGYVRRRDGR